MGVQIGELLNRRWRLGARHALYHKDGVWYHQLRRFPGALCDPNGYVLFRTEAQFRSSPRLRIDQDVNVTGHLSQVAGYVQVPANLRYKG
jgi:5-methylcytosine-specific restriction protein A